MTDEWVLHAVSERGNGVQAWAQSRPPLGMTAPNWAAVLHARAEEVKTLSGPRCWATGVRARVRRRWRGPRAGHVARPHA